MNEYDQPKLLFPKRLIHRAEMSDVWSYLEETGATPLAITGPPGIGKTTLAVAAHKRCIADGWRAVWSLRIYEYKTAGLVLAGMSLPNDPSLLIVDDFDTWPAEKRNSIFDGIIKAMEDSNGKLRCLLLARRLPPEFESRVKKVEIQPLSVSDSAALLGVEFTSDALFQAVQGNPLTINLIRRLAASAKVSVHDLLGQVMVGEKSGAISTVAPKTLWTPKPATIEVVREFSEEYFREVACNPSITYSLSARRFEKFIAALWERLGWTVELTKQTRDGGADIIAVRSDLGGELKVLIEAKRFHPDRPISVGVIRQLFSVRETKGANKAVLATTSYFSPDCHREFTRFVPYILEFHDLHQIQKWVRLSMQ